MKDFSPDWWQHIFDETYLVTDARTVADPKVTAAEADMLVDLLDLEPGDHILDLCGGHGRHALELSRRGFRNLTVMDYSLFLLEHGRGNLEGNGGVRFCRGDARCLGFSQGSFDAVVVMGNSFGYFMDDAENIKIIREINRVLKPGGRLLLDLANRDHVGSNLAPVIWHEADGDVIVCRKRTLKKQGVAAREIVLSRERGLVRESAYFFRLFRRAEIRKILGCHGFDEISIQDGYRSHQDQTDMGLFNNRVLVTAKRQKSAPAPDKTRPMPKGAPPDKGTIRTFQPGDMGWVIKRHAEFYAKEHGFSVDFERYVLLAFAEFARKMQDTRSMLWIAELEGKPVGSIGVVETGEDTAQMRWLLVENAAQNLGLGRRLIEQALDFCRDTGLKRVFLWTLKMLSPARHLYESLGFTLTEEKQGLMGEVPVIEERWDLVIKPEK
ncbi:MAG: GNAT family N-acetyltransferase [Thermodesulfobacteriota bacterium]|nr:GNAT family N-acetyltransferase [Thermodesulfobacteriota bacterium]